MGTTKKVSATDFNIAYANHDNRSIIQFVTAKYANCLNTEDRNSCGLIALWRCLAYHDPVYNTKFTTSLWRFVDWECKRELRKKKMQITHISIEDKHVDIEDTNINNSFIVKECMDSLPEKHRNILTAYFLENRTMEEIGKMNGYSKEAARQKINKAVKQLRGLYNNEQSKS